VTPVEDTATISVNIAHQVSAISLVLPAVETATIVIDTAVATSLPPTSALNFAISGKVISGPGGSGKLWVIKWSNPQSVVSVNVGKSKFLVNHGYIQLRAVNAVGIGFRIEATNLLRLHDEYLYGIAEVPSSWPTAALESQAIASRTYALMRMNSIKKACDCHVYNSKYDQAFVGYSKEGEPRYGQFWKAAVDATAVDEGHGLAITIDELPVSVFFSSSSGGMTQRAVDVWGTDIPHLVNVADPWSIDPAVNKNYANWTKKVSQKIMAKAFGLTDVAEIKLGARTATNSVLNVTGISSEGKSKTLPVGTFKSAVKMPSSWFELV
jgi:SpoIID/LytB domain protein